MSLKSKLLLLYGSIALLSLGVAIKLGYHEFVTEPRDFAQMGFPEIHKETSAEMDSVILFSSIPVMLALGWIWIIRALQPLTLLVEKVEALGEEKWNQRLPLTGRNDEVDRLSAVFNQMAETLAVKFQRIRAQKRSISHELKTPIAIMRLQLEELLRDEKGRTFDAESGGVISHQLEELKRLSDMVGVLTLISVDPKSGGLPDMEELDLAELVDEIGRDAKLLAEAQSISVGIDLEKPVLVRGNRQRLRQLLLILVENALRYNKPSGILNLTLVRDLRGWELAVLNSSSAELPPDPDQLFNPFVRGEHTSVGTGLGLALARWIARMHGWEILIRAEGRGEVVVRLTDTPLHFFGNNLSRVVR
jgi:signal transduction histidine kinase